MGNWRTVQVEGKVNPEEAKQMIQSLTPNWDSETWIQSEDNNRLYFLLHGDGICALGRWVYPNGEIKGQGNVYERNCEIEDLKNELTYLAEKFPSLDMKLHAGADYEDEACVATFIVYNGKVAQVEPMIDKVSGVTPEQMRVNLLKQLGGFR